MIEHKNQNFILRAIIDSGSGRSYITKRTVNKFGYEPIGSVEITHILFGGHTTNSKRHKVYNIVLADMENTTSMQLEFSDTDKICSAISTIPNGPSIEELGYRGIYLSDYTKDQLEIEMLIGADQASTLYTGRICPTQMVPVAFETNDPVENRNREELTKSALIHFNEKVYRLEDGRYEVELPWIDGHAPIGTNKDMADKRLKATLVKLQRLGKENDYQQVFDKWLELGMIEEVLVNDVDNQDVCYLPHHAVFNPKSSTTP